MVRAMNCGTPIQAMTFKSVFPELSLREGEFAEEHFNRKIEQFSSQLPYCARSTHIHASVGPRQSRQELRPFAVSAMKRLPEASTTKPVGQLSCALAAGASSPE
jgi:hypothetical protein